MTMRQMPSTALRQASALASLRPHCSSLMWYVFSKPSRTRTPTIWARAWPTGCIRKTEASMVTLDDVLDHSEVMTAESGYSAPMPLRECQRRCLPARPRWRLQTNEPMPMTKRH